MLPDMGQKNFNAIQRLKYCMKKFQIFDIFEITRRHKDYINPLAALLGAEAVTSRKVLLLELPPSSNFHLCHL